MDGVGVSQHEVGGGGGQVGGGGGLSAEDVQVRRSLAALRAASSFESSMGENSGRE